MNAILTSRPQLGPAAEQQYKIKANAEAFEAILLQHWWASMAQSELGGEEQDPALATFQSCGMQAVSLAVAHGGGIGIARLLEQALEKRPAELPLKPGRSPDEAAAKPGSSGGARL
ncbi:MAG TPA: hypothetical protein VE996_07260 [Terriglobales bacterium]|nr:hypothetical protein [Terriglobales bacterium]